MLRLLFEALAYMLFEASWHGVIHAWQRKAPDPLRRCPYDWRDDPVYKKNLRRLIERNREFEEARK